MAEHTGARGLIEPRAGSRLRALLDGVDALPALPPVARELMAMGDLEHADIDQIARLIEIDPGLSARVLALCRGAHTGLGDRIGTVRHAAVMLGVACIRRLVLSAQACELLREQAADLDDSGRTMGFGDDGFDRDGYWMHCVAVACGAERVARQLPGLIPPDLAFMAGLLHGIGRLVLELVAPRAMSRIMQLAAREGVSGADAERRVLGIDAPAVGRHLGERWGLPGDVVATITWHDEPPGEAPEHGDLVRVVAVSKWLCRRYFLGWSGDWHDPGDGRSRCRAIGLDAGTARGLMPEIIASCGRRVGELGFGTERGTRWGVSDHGGADMAALISEEAHRRLDAGRRSILRRAPTVVPPGSGRVRACSAGLVGS